MSKLNERGALNALFIPFMTLVVFFLSTAGFAIWAYLGRQDYKNNSDQKSAVAVEKAVTATQRADAAKYFEEAKKPYDTYIGPAAFGNITVNYPKTWSAYVAEDSKGGDPIKAYFHPKTVPNVADADQNFALRVDLIDTNYNDVLTQFQAQIEIGKVSAAPYKLPKIPSVVGSRLEGQITPTKQGSMVLLPLRNMTLKIWTESNDFKADFDTNILPNLNFVP